MLRKFRPLFACAAILLVTGLAVRSYDARRRFPTPQPERSTAPSPVVATRSNAMPDNPPSLETPRMPSVAAEVNPLPPSSDGAPQPAVLAGLQPRTGSEEPAKIIADAAVNSSAGVPESPSLPPVSHSASPLTAPPPPPARSEVPTISLVPPPILAPDDAPTAAAPGSIPNPAPSRTSPVLTAEIKVAPCPWTFQVAVVNGRTQLEARSDNEVQFTVSCDHLSMQSPSGQVCATGNVKVTGLNVEGSCEKLTLGWHDEKVLLEGKVRLRCKQDGQDVDLSGEQLSVKLAVIETLPPPAPAE